MRRLKAVASSWLRTMALRLPKKPGICMMNLTLPVKRPVLGYLEFHLADHCNLNCAGCFHYSPFAQPRLADLDTVARDFARLGEIFSNIRSIRVMGGEPLLHPEAAKAVRIARAAFPRSKISVTTNGLKLVGTLDAGTEALLGALAETGSLLDWTVYPPMAEKAAEIRTLCLERGVQLRESWNFSFMARLLPCGGADIGKSFRWCRERMYCPFLDDGRIYLCAQGRHAPLYNAASGAQIPAEQGIDIHTHGAWEILSYLFTPSSTCSWCAQGGRHFDWKRGGNPKDWLI